MDIVLDTNVIHNEGFNSIDMYVLKRLCKDEHVKIYIPDIARSEFISKRVKEIEDIYSGFEAVIKGNGRKLNINEKFNTESKELNKHISAFKAGISKNVEQAFNEWAESLGVEVIKFNNEYFDSVINDYFQGGGAFKSPKCRDDFPDSFIYYSIIELFNNNEEVNVVVNDKVLQGALQNKGIQTYKTLSELFESYELRDYVKNPKLEVFFQKNEVQQACLQFLKLDLNTADMYFYEEEVKSSYLLGVDFWGENIQIWDLDGFSFDRVNYVNYINEDELAVSIKIKGTTGIRYAAYYSEFLYLQSIGRDVEMDSMSGHGACDLSESVIVELNLELLCKVENEQYSLENKHQFMNSLKKSNVLVDAQSIEIVGFPDYAP